MPYINDGFIYTAKVMKLGQVVPLVGFTLQANLIGGHNRLMLDNWVNVRFDSTLTQFEASFSANDLVDLREGDYFVIISLSKDGKKVTLLSDILRLSRYKVESNEQPSGQNPPGPVCGGDHDNELGAGGTPRVPGTPIYQSGPEGYYGAT